MRVNTTVKLSDSDLIFLGGAAILGSMVREARSRKEAVRFIGDALHLSARLLEAHQAEWKLAGSRRMADITAAVAAVAKRAKKAKKPLATAGRFAEKCEVVARSLPRKQRTVTPLTANGDAAHRLHSLDLPSPPRPIFQFPPRGAIRSGA
jgi:hypothetical protein